MKLYGAQVSQNYIQLNNRKRREHTYPDSNSYPRDREPAYWQIQEEECPGRWTTVYYTETDYIAKDEVERLNKQNPNQYRAVSPLGHIYTGPTFVERK